MFRHLVFHSVSLSIVFGLFVWFSSEIIAFPSPKNNNELVSRFAYHPQWLRLMHYKKRFFGGYESEVDGTDFFYF